MRQILLEGPHQSPPPAGTSPRASGPPGERGFHWKSAVQGDCLHRSCPSACVTGAARVGWDCTEARTSPGSGRALHPSRGCRGGVTGLLESQSPAVGLAHPPEVLRCNWPHPRAGRKRDSCPSASASVSGVMQPPASPHRQRHGCPQARVPVCGVETWPGVTVGATGVGAE